jgi:hypothetical protein
MRLETITKWPGLPGLLILTYSIPVSKKESNNSKILSTSLRCQRPANRALCQLDLKKSIPLSVQNRRCLRAQHCTEDTSQ